MVAIDLAWKATSELCKSPAKSIQEVETGISKKRPKAALVFDLLALEKRWPCEKPFENPAQTELTQRIKCFWVMHISAIAGKVTVVSEGVLGVRHPSVSVLGELGRLWTKVLHTKPGHGDLKSPGWGGAYSPFFSDIVLFLYSKC